MKTIEIKLFSYSELSDEGRAAVLDAKRKWIQDDPETPWLDEAVKSVRIITRALELPIANYELGPFHFNHIYLDDTSNARLIGNNAMDHFLSVIESYGYPKFSSYTEVKFEGICGFTGVYWDDLILKTIWKSLCEKKDFHRSFGDVAQAIKKSLEKDYYYRISDEGILETLDQSEEVYLENGKEFDL